MKQYIAYKNISDLLISRSWKKVEASNKYDIFIPPAELNFSSTFKLYVYSQFDRIGYDNEIYKSLETISKIYDEDIDELNSIILNDRQILSIKIDNIDNSNLLWFNNLVQQIFNILHDTASFSIERHPYIISHNENLINKFLQKCEFMKQSSGSIIVKIQLPNNEIIKPATPLLPIVKGKDINQNLITLTDFINEKVIVTKDFDDSFIKTFHDYTSINFANRLSELYKGVNVDIELKTAIQQFKTTAKNYDTDNCNLIKKYVSFAEQKLTKILNNPISYKIMPLNLDNSQKNGFSTILAKIIEMLKDNYNSDCFVILKGFPNTLIKETSQYIPFFTTESILFTDDNKINLKSVFEGQKLLVKKMLTEKTETIKLLLYEELTLLAPQISSLFDDKQFIVIKNNLFSDIPNQSNIVLEDFEEISIKDDINQENELFNNFYSHSIIDNGINLMALSQIEWVWFN